MTKLSQKEIAVGIFGAINKRDFTEFESYINEDIILNFPAVDQMKGAKRVMLFFNILFRKYKSLKFNVSDVIVQENKACVMWNNEGEETDGTSYSNTGLTWFYFTNGRISLMSDFFKDTSFTKSK